MIIARILHWKWRETKQQTSRARSGHQISCCLVSLHFLCDILTTITVHYGGKGVYSTVTCLKIAKGVGSMQLRLQESVHL